jgi:dihydrofolate reductase
MRKIILYIAASLDGYIARENGAIDWLPAEDPKEDYGYKAFLGSVDTIIMGRKTYDQILTFSEFPYKDKKCYVFTTDFNRFDHNVQFVDKNITCFTGNIKHQKGSDIWLVGGSEIIDIFIKAKMIDEIILFIIPTILGNGIPLFRHDDNEIKLQLKYSKQYPSGIVQLNYEPII